MISYNMQGVRNGYIETELSKAVFSAFLKVHPRKDGAYRTKEFTLNGKKYEFSSHYGNRTGWSGWACTSHPDFMEVLV